MRQLAQLSKLAVHHIKKRWEDFSFIERVSLIQSNTRQAQSVQNPSDTPPAVNALRSRRWNMVLIAPEQKEWLINVCENDASWSCGVSECSSSPALCGWVDFATTTTAASVRLVKYQSRVMQDWTLKSLELLVSFCYIKDNQQAQSETVKFRIGRFLL